MMSCGLGGLRFIRKQKYMNKLAFTAKLNIIRKKPKPLLTGMLIGLLYLLLYLFSIEHLFRSGQTAAFTMVEEPLGRMLMMRAPFLWEPVAALALAGFTLFVSPLNLLLGSLLGFLVGVNIMVAVFSYQFRNTCRINTGYGLAGVLPGMLSGFACCAPTFIIALTPALGSFTVFFLAIQPFLIPFSLIVMLLGLYWSVSQLPLIVKEKTNPWIKNS